MKDEKPVVAVVPTTIGHNGRTLAKTFLRNALTPPSDPDLPDGVHLFGPGVIVNPKLPPLPKEMSQMPTDHRGYPVLFTAARKPDGSPDFQVSDGRKRERCAKEDLCGICGQRLSYEKVLVGGPSLPRNRVTAEPPMHRACALYSKEVCPWLLGRQSQRRASRGEAGPAAVHAVQTTLILYTTRKVSTVSDGGSGFLFKGDAPLTVERFEVGKP